MAQVITFEDYTPIARYDLLPWTDVQIEESLLVTGPWMLIDTLTLSPVDVDPSDPQVRNFTTELADDAPDLWYRIIFVDGNGDTSLPTTPVQNSNATSPYATVDELFRLLKIRTPSDEQRTAGERVLVAAAGEIDAEIDLDADSALSGWQLALAAQVNLQRAEELWQLQEVALGITGLGSEFGATHLARNSWDKYAYTLAPLKGQWGLA